MLALWIIAGIILLVVLVLSIPVDLTFEVATQTTGGQKVRVGWLFGLVGKDILPGKKKPPKKKKPEKVKKIKKRKRPSPGLILSVLRTRGLVAWVVKFARRMLRSLHFRNLDGSLRLGMPDPADTGLIYGLTWPAFLPRSSDSIRFRMEPAFEGPVFEAALQGAVRVFPAQMATNIVIFVVSPQGLRIIRLMVGSWWKRRK